MPQADSPPLQLLGLMAETLSITNIARLINVPQFSTTSLVQSRIGNTPVYTYTLAHTHTHKRMYMRIHTYIYVFPISEMSSERHPQKNCSTSTIIDMLSMRTSGTPRRRSGVQLPLRFVRASSWLTCCPRHCWWKTLFGCRSYCCSLQLVYGMNHEEGQFRQHNWICRSLHKYWYHLSFCWLQQLM